MKVFISYKSQNRDFANHLRDTLHSWGDETWMDVHAIPPGAVWTDEIQKGLEWADVTVGVMTEIALRSENVKNEWNWTIAYRQKYGKRLILLRLEDCDVPMHYITLNWIDIASMGQETGLNLLQNWLHNPNENIADASPVTNDPYQEYLETLYSELVDELDYLVLSVERMMEIPGRSTPEQVQTQPRMLRSFSMRRTKEEAETTITSFEEGFKKYKGRLLLLGEPGAGKTITLLTTARDAVLQRLQNPSAPFPLIGRIATWNASEQTPLHEWLAEYSTLTAGTIKREIDSGNCLLLLDGLDELGNSRTEKDKSGKETTYDPRLRFIEQINQLPSKNQILVTSRIADYEQSGEKLSLNGSVTLGTLTDDQIRDYLNSTEATKTLWDALQAQPDLLDVARIPLLLSLFAFAFRDLPEEIRNLQDLSQGELRDAIFEQHIQKRYEHEAQQYQLRDEDLPFTLQEIFYNLGLIAYKYMPDFQKDINKLSSELIVTWKFARKINLVANDESRFIHLILEHFLKLKYCKEAMTFVNDDLTQRINNLPENTLTFLGGKKHLKQVISGWWYKLHNQEDFIPRFLLSLEPGLDILANSDFSTMPSLTDEMIVLVIDDNVDNLHLLLDVIEISEIRAVATISSAVGIILAEILQPKIILSDISRPNLDGLATLDLMQTHISNFNFRVIICSALEIKDIFQKAEKHGNDFLDRANVAYFIQKPFSIKHIIFCIKKLLQI